MSVPQKTRTFGAGTTAAERAGAVAVAGVAPYALDRENAARLWALSEALVR